MIIKLSYVQTSILSTPTCEFFSQPSDAQLRAQHSEEFSPLATTMRFRRAVKILAVIAAIVAVNIASTMILSKFYSPSQQSSHQRSSTFNDEVPHRIARKKASSATAASVSPSSDGTKKHRAKAPAKKSVRMKVAGVSAANGKCADRRCTQFLSEASRALYKECGDVAFEQTHIKDADIPHTCTFMDGRGRDPVGLVSVPGSGNTWVRGLLEKATGICTGAIYCDIPLRNSGFVGESVRDGSVLVVKTHTQNFQWKDAELLFHSKKDALYSSAIFLIRNPFDAFVAERHRLKVLENMDRNDGSHVDKVDKTQFGNNTDWDEYIHRIAVGWKRAVFQWVGSAHKLKKPLLVVDYEDVKRDKVKEVSRMLDFLHQDYNRTELAARLEAGFGQFHRPHAAQDNYDHYTEQQKAYVKTQIQTLIEQFKSKNVHYPGLKLAAYLKK